MKHLILVSLAVMLTACGPSPQYVQTAPPVVYQQPPVVYQQPQQVIVQDQGMSAGTAAVLAGTAGYMLGRNTTTVVQPTPVYYDRVDRQVIQQNRSTVVNNTTIVQQATPQKTAPLNYKAQAPRPVATPTPRNSADPQTFKPKR